MRKLLIALLMAASLMMPTLAQAATGPIIYVVTPPYTHEGWTVFIDGDNFKPDSAVIIGGLRASSSASNCVTGSDGRIKCSTLRAIAPYHYGTGVTSLIVLNPNGLAAYTTIQYI